MEISKGVQSQVEWSKMFDATSSKVCHSFSIVIVYGFTWGVLGGIQNNLMSHA